MQLLPGTARVCVGLGLNINFFFFKLFNYFNFLKQLEITLPFPKLTFFFTPFRFKRSENYDLFLNFFFLIREQLRLFQFMWKCPYVYLFGRIDVFPKRSDPLEKHPTSSKKNTLPLLRGVKISINFTTIKHSSFIR